MKRFLLTSTLLATVGAFPAIAADIGYPTGSETTPIEFGSGWYLRGDVSYNFGGRLETTGSLDYSTNTRTQAEYTDAFGVGGGFGLRLSNSVRIDVTAERLFGSNFSEFGPERFSGSAVQQRTVYDASGNPVYENGVYHFDRDAAGNFVVTSVTNYPGVAVGDATTGILGTVDISNSYDLTPVLANAYYDLPQMGAFTPYVGAGIGAARVNYTEKYDYNCTSTSVSTPTSTTTYNCDNIENQEASESYWAFAYKLSAGTGIKLQENLTLDIGYSYLHVGDGPTINYEDGRALEPDGVSVHQVKAGLRYEIW